MLRSSEGQRPLREEKKRRRATRRVGSRGRVVVGVSRGRLIGSRLIGSVNGVAAQGSRGSKSSR